MKGYVFFLLLVIISCKQNESKVKVVPKDETLDLKYEVLNQLIKNDSLVGDFDRFIYNETLLPATINENIDEPKLLGVNLKYDTVFLRKDSVYYIEQEKLDLNFKLNKNKIKSSLKYVTDEELYKLRENEKKDFWTEFDKKFNGKCIRTYSVPFFNKAKTICVVQNSISCGPLNATGNISIYKKTNGVWIQVASYNHWIS